MSTKRRSYIDHQHLAAQFHAGDLVQFVNPVTGKTFAYKGVVTNVESGIGFVDVEFAWGRERLSPEKLIKVSTESSSKSTQNRDKTMTADSRLARLVAFEHREENMAPLAKSASSLWIEGLSEMDTYAALYEQYGESHSDHVIREAVQAVFHDDTNDKTAMYWYQSGRQYRPSQKELETGNFGCPRCKCNMKKTNYKKHTKLWGCPDCLFLIKPADILDSLDEEDQEKYRNTIDFSDSSGTVSDWL